MMVALVGVELVLSTRVVAEVAQVALEVLQNKITLVQQVMVV